MKKLGKKIIAGFLIIFMGGFSPCLMQNKAMATSVVNSNVKSGYKLSINRGPVSASDLTNKNYLILNFADGNGISKIKVEKYNPKTKKFTNITNNKNVIISKDKKQLKIGANELCEKGESVKIKIIAWDSTKLTSKYKIPEWTQRFYTVKRLKEKDSKDRYFVINGGPRITNVVESDFKNPTTTPSEAFKQAKISIRLRDENRVQSLRVCDMNNLDEKGNGKVVARYNFTGKNKTELVDFSSFSKLKQVEGKYRIQLVAIDGTQKGHNEVIQISANYYKNASNVDKKLTK